MAFKPYCYECSTWHTEDEGHTDKKRSEKNDREIASGVRCSGLCKDGSPCNC